VGFLGTTLVVVLLTLVFTRDSKKASATLHYWNQLRAIDAQVTSGELGLRTENIASSKESLRTVGALRRAASEEIAALDVNEVDERLVELGSEKSKFFGDSAILCDQFVDWLGQVEDFNQPSIPKMAEWFLRGFFGDPLGPFRESIGDEKNLRARQQKLVNEAHEIQRRSNQLTSQTHKVRAELTRRYSREFPIPPGK
jgi:hypothetical protein